jgi:two-component system cell cycle response regulator DivK
MQGGASLAFSVFEDPMPHRKTAAALSVLVVDDFPDGRELVAEYLTFRGFDVHVASDGAEAIAVARKVRPAIVLMDLSMPGIDGWQATRILKSDPNTQAITVIAVTAHALKRETDAAKAAGCDGVISKPFDLTALADALPLVLKQGPKALKVPGLSVTPIRGANTRRNSSRPT